MHRPRFSHSTMFTKSTDLYTGSRGLEDITGLSKSALLLILCRMGFFGT